MNKTERRIAFIGGIHGVGKSTICQHICRVLNMKYLSASELLKWEDISDDAKNKKVKDIHFTQNRLIAGLTNAIQKEQYYLLDGHFCLLNEKAEVEKISMDVFKQINPKALGLILGDITEIKTRLALRDNKNYDFELLEQLQNSELDYAKEISVALKIPLYIEKSNVAMNLSNHLSKIYNQNG
ncbi:ATP-binding protein [Maribacter sp. 4G9]|uniref:ATP-binding protein n=1 Tax=Maribacter sp. 4G9 TaxID=1889777 RepID=UPI000C152209|nr:ATP-binding protein [Maribacter sp. 4G9]